ncbi:MAG TPA: hypothetical protein ENN85_05570 [Methanoculleus sp.]|nr:hypothetical protein [Methanoculleus sp.]
MYSTVYGKGHKRELPATDISRTPSISEERLPTLEKRLDRYFDTHMQAIVDEWGLVTAHDLAVFEKRLEDISREIKGLESGRDRLEQRALAVDAALKEVEQS